ncbi:hemolysin/hemagglutinin-like protein HecA precursor [bacterium endosymbiont of Mortierella elongata FMR23-6]|nr:hemolysin/hemagglutinin-like protein HecA precursor [bacterium endosymbiont of Mortierella elongata FMR23-6]
MPVAERQELLETAAELRAQAQTVNKQWGPGGTYRRIVTALTAAASGNVTGTTAEFAQAAALNYLQSLGAEKIKHIADSLKDETARAALHGALAYGGAVARGQSGGAAALGASASVLVNNLLGPVDDFSKEEKEARKNLVTSLVAGLADLGGADASSAQNAAQIETDNNMLAPAIYGFVALAARLAMLGTRNEVKELAIGAAAATTGAVVLYELDKKLGKDEGQVEENELIQPPPPPMVTPMEPQRPSQIPGRAWHQDEEVLLEGMPNQSGEHIVQPLTTPGEVQQRVEPINTPINQEVNAYGNAIFSKGAKKANKDKDYVPNAGSVHRIEDFFNQTEFGAEVKSITKRTNEFFQGARIYEATEEIGDKIKDGDLIYLDKFHKNHLEVYTELRISRHVLNFDGTINQEKTEKARGRRLGK